MSQKVQAFLWLSCPLFVKKRSARAEISIPTLALGGSIIIMLMLKRCEISVSLLYISRVIKKPGYLGEYDGMHLVLHIWGWLEGSMQLFGFCRAFAVPGSFHGSCGGPEILSSSKLFCCGCWTPACKINCLGYVWIYMPYGFSSSSLGCQVEHYRPVSVRQTSLAWGKIVSFYFFGLCPKNRQWPRC